jgi:FkbM family methyltransferase
MSEPTISYAQRYEDMHLLRCFGERTSGFYIDVGAGHPVYDNVSFAFYLRGWSGITVEPNPWLAQLSATVRPRDRRIQSLVGAAAGEATYYLVEDFHGLSTTIASHAQAAQAELGKAAQAMTVPVTTLRTLCEQNSPGQIDFLKVDVEGAEPDVLAGGDWQRFRPKVVVVEALAPLTLAPSWQTWEPTLTSNGYRFAFFDTLNRYYVAQGDELSDDLAARLAAEPPSFESVKKFSNFRHARDDASHPDHRLAALLAGVDMIRLPLLQADAIMGLLTAGLETADLGKAATATDLALAHEHLFGGPPSDAWVAGLALSRDATTRELYLRIISSERFQTACGRISASYAW